jgi:DNA-binding GntR family transcriptional regulator
VAETLQVSRTPVREALRQLEREGLLVGQGVDLAVTNPNREEFVELYTCRMALERLVAERAAELATTEEIDEMATAIEEARGAISLEDHAGVVSANTRFHDRMVESARMPPLHRLMDTIRGQILVARRHVLSDSMVETEISDEHSALLEAIRNRESRTAQERMELHMRNDIGRLASSEQPTAKSKERSERAKDLGPQELHQCPKSPLVLR